MAPSLRRVQQTEVRYVLRDHRDLPAAEQPVWVLMVPGNAAFAAFVDDFLGRPRASDLGAVERFLIRLENHPDAQRCGAAGTPARAAFVESLSMAYVVELAREVSAQAVLTEPERKNSDSPSASSAMTGGEPAAVASTPVPTT